MKLRARLMIWKHNHIWKTIDEKLPNMLTKLVINCLFTAGYTFRTNERAPDSTTHLAKRDNCKFDAINYKEDIK